MENGLLCYVCIMKGWKNDIDKHNTDKRERLRPPDSD